MKKSAIEQAKEMFNRGVQPIRNFITDLPANRAYVQAKIAQKILPKYQLPTPNEIENQKQYDSQFYYNLNTGPNKSMSAELNSYPVAPDTPQARFMEGIKQDVLNKGEFRPAMKKYLSTVPIYTTNPNQQFAGVANTFRKTPEGTPWELSSGGGEQPTIGMALSENANTDKLKNNPYVNEVMAHELVHATPRNKEFKNFEEFFKSVTPETSPMLYEVGLQYYQNGDTPPNAEEFYAVVAQKLGPYVLQIPEIKRFYENIFAEQPRKVNFSVSLPSKRE